MARATLGLLLLAALAAVGAARCGRFPGRGLNLAAAQCIHASWKCTAGQARASGLCRKVTFANSQSWACRGAACGFCACYPNAYPCPTPFMRRVCDLPTGLPRGPSVWAAARPWEVRKPAVAKPPPPTAPFRPKGSGTGSCVRRAKNGHVAIMPTWTTAAKAWGRSRGGRCLVWKPWLMSKDIDPPGQGKVCYEFTVDKEAHYYFTIESAAPHPVDWNDVWVSFPTGGFRLFKVGSNAYKGGKNSYSWGWLKGYQNVAKSILTNTLVSVDFDGHQFETPLLKPRKVYKVCLSGRSSRYEICKIHFASCNNQFKAGCVATRPDIQARIKSKYVSLCV